jgi:DNA polymerase-3 subunit beta
LPAAEFPVIEQINSQLDLDVDQKSLRRLLEKTHFSMAQQDVRYYLNGMLVEAEGGHLRTVATDGHRLAMSEIPLGKKLDAAQQVIVPRKGVLELQRLLGDEGSAAVSVGTNHIRVSLDGIRFTSKLIDGRFPEYSRVIPQNQDKHLVADRNLLRAALQRTAILSNEKYRGIRLELKDNGLVVQAHNPEQEEAEEEIEVSYQGDGLEIGFNVNYLLDALAAVDGEQVRVGLHDPNSSCLISGEEASDCKYVVMPMRL